MIEMLGEKFAEGGMWMWPLVACSFLGLAIAIERFFVLAAATRVSKGQLMTSLNGFIVKGQISQALALVSNVKTPMTNIIHSGLNAIVNGGDASDVQTSMDAVALREIPSLEKRIGFLSTLANIATLLGLLGTVAGLIGAFDGIATVSASEKSAYLTSQIAIAMNTTAGGLIVAIPLLGAYGYLSAKAQAISDDVSEVSVATLNFIIANQHKIKGMKKVG